MPASEDLEAQIAGLSPERRRLLELLRRDRAEQSARGAEGTDASAPFGLIPAEDRERLPARVDDAYPLTRMQAGMLFHMELTPEYPLYHNVDSWHLSARFEPELFRLAVQGVVKRHPVLRTSFDLTRYSEPLQLVHRVAELPVPVVDLRELAPEVQDDVVDRFVDAEKRHRFDYTRPPLLRFHVHLRGERTFQFTITEFHPILDGWSLQSTLAEILGGYNALLRGETPPEPPSLSSSFRDFVRLEREALQSEESRTFWEERLAGCTAIRVPRWPERFRRRGGTPYRMVYRPLASEVFDAFRALARSEQVPMKALFSAVHVKVLALLSGQDDVLTGLIVHGRPEGADGDRVRGLFLNTVPLRLRLPPGSWRRLVRAAFEAERELVPHRRFPLAEIQRRWGRERLFETALNATHFRVYEGASDPTGRGGGIEVGALGGRELEENSFTVCTTFGIDPSGSSLQLMLSCDRRELADAQIEQIVRLYLSAIEEVVARPDADHRQTCLLSRGQLQQVLAEWNDTAAPLPYETTLSELIAATAAGTPDAVAVRCGETTLTYHGLRERVVPLAERLRGLGVGPESRVAVAVERSIEMVVGLLAVEEAGGAYVPLDPDYPRALLAFMLEDAGVHALLTQPHLAGELGHAELPVIVVGGIDEPRPGGEIPSSEGAPAAADPGNAAYVIYTSGSTGRPKGVVNSHRGVVNRILWMQRAYRLGPDDNVLHKTPLAFDVSVWELFWPLVTGATLVVARPGGHLDSGYLADLVQQERVTTLHFVPSMLQIFLEEERLGERCISLRRAIASGEALSHDLEQRFLDRMGDRPGAELHNLYGPTEAAIDVTAWRCRRELRREAVPIGRPIANLRAHVQDRNGAPVPAGVAGELTLGGVGLARGYLGRAGLTAERFVPDGTGPGWGERLYRTGDLVRFLPDGDLDFLGRLDHQVKIRGFRIELAEIEAALAAHRAVREAAVVICGEAPDLRLAAYVVADGAEPPEEADLRSWLRQTLQEIKVPAWFTFLERLPLSPNGKLDRRALPAPAPVDPETRQGFTPPRSALERTIAEVWQEVLEMEVVGVEQGFFDLGGHSLLLLRAHKRLEEVLERDLVLTDLFRYPTIAAFAEFLSGGDGGERTVRQGVQRAERRDAARGRQAQMLERRRAARGNEVRNGS